MLTYIAGIVSFIVLEEIFFGYFTYKPKTGAEIWKSLSKDQRRRFLEKLNEQYSS